MTSFSSSRLGLAAGLGVARLGLELLNELFGLERGIVSATDRPAATVPDPEDPGLEPLESVEVDAIDVIGYLQERTDRKSGQRSTWAWCLEPSHLRRARRAAGQGALVPIHMFESERMSGRLCGDPNCCVEWD